MRLSRRIPLVQRDTLDPELDTMLLTIMEIDVMDNGRGQGKSKGKGKDAFGDKGKATGMQPKEKGNSKVTSCWNCGKPRHRQADCSSAPVAQAPAPAIHAAAVASARCTEVHLSTTVTVHNRDQRNHTPENHATSCDDISDTRRFAQRSSSCDQHKFFRLWLQHLDEFAC